MYECSTFLVAQGKSLDVETQALSIFNVFGDVGAVGFPVILSPIVVVAFVSRDRAGETAHTLQLIVEHNTNILIDFPMSVQFGDRLNARAFATIQGLIIPAPGPVIFQLKDGANQLSSFSIGVTALPAAQATPPTATISQQALLVSPVVD